MFQNSLGQFTSTISTYIVIIILLMLFNCSKTVIIYHTSYIVITYLELLFHFHKRDRK